MRFLLVLIFPLLLTYGVQAQELAPLTLVFDIDWTSFYTVEADQKDEKTLLVEGKLYRPTDHFLEFVAYLKSQHPEVRLGFFSGGERSRNETLLKNVLLPDGRSLFEVSDFIFSKEQLTVVSTDPAARFSVRHKKILDKHLPSWDPARTLLIDDLVDFAVPPLKAVNSFGVFSFQKNFDATKSGEKFFPPQQKDWQWERNKALLWWALFETALAESERSGTAFSEVAAQLWQRHGQDQLMMHKGLLLSRQWTPTLPLTCGKIFAL